MVRARGRSFLVFGRAALGSAVVLLAAWVFVLVLAMSWDAAFHLTPSTCVGLVVAGAVGLTIGVWSVAVATIRRDGARWPRRVAIFTLVSGTVAWAPRSPARTRSAFPRDARAC